MKFLAIFECPCIGCNEELIYADTFAEADEIAWDKSCMNKNYVQGGYELYQISYNPIPHCYELTLVTPLDIAMEGTDNA